MTTLERRFWLAALAVGFALLVSSRAHGQIIMGNPMPWGAGEQVTNGIFSSNSTAKFDVPYIGFSPYTPSQTNTVILHWTLLTNYPPGVAPWYDVWCSTNLTTGYQFCFGRADGLDGSTTECSYPVIVSPDYDYAVAHYGIGPNTNDWRYLLTRRPLWFTIKVSNQADWSVLGYYTTNVIGKSSVTNRPGDLLEQAFGMSINGSTIPTGVVSDVTNNVYVCGHWSGQATFGSIVTNTPLAQYTCGFLVKYNSNGVMQWFKSFVGTNFSNTGNTACKAVALDSGGNVILVGNFQNTVNFGNGSNVTVASGNYSGTVDGFVAKYDGVGTLAWVKDYASTTFDVGSTVAVDSTNGIFIVQDTVVGAVIGVGLKKLSDSDGATLWSTNHSGAYWALAKGVAVDANNCPVVCGSVQGPSIDLGGGTLTASGSFNILLAKYDGANGDYQWGKLMGSSGGNQGFAVATDTNRNVILTGLFNGSIDLGGGSVNGGSIFLTGYNSTGTWLWNMVTGTGSDSGTAIRVSGNNLAVGGRCGSGIYFPGMTLSQFANGQVNPWVASFTLSDSSAPTYSWSRLGGANYDGAGNVNGIGFDLAGRIIPVGAFMGTEDFGLGPVTATGAGYSSGFTLWYQN